MTLSQNLVVLCPVNNSDLLTQKIYSIVPKDKVTINSEIKTGSC
jgi:hypothetical protein